MTPSKRKRQSDRPTTPARGRAGSGSTGGAAGRTKTAARTKAPSRAPAEDVTVAAGLPFPLGATPRDGGLNVAVYSETAEAVEVSLFDGPRGAAGGDRERTVRLVERSGHVFHGFLEGITVGQRYGLRVHGPWDPAAGLRHNPHKLLLDPWATAVEGDVLWSEDVFGHFHESADERNDADSAPAVPRCVVTARDFDWEDDAAPRIPLAETVVYETHVKGLTQTMPGVPEELRGTYAGLGHDTTLKYLKGLGVTAVELLPVHQFLQDSHLLEKGLRNYWGYNSIGFLAPHGDYAAAGDGGGQVDEFKQMVKDVHAAGLEVILDVVYNHTAEGNHLGPTVSLKGIDNGSYYRLVDEERAHYFDTTGTGNSLNVSHPAGLQLIMDSLRYWVTEMHVDGFRFDLATTLTRQAGDADVHSAFLSLCHQDPVLAPVKLIAEPWDTAGYQVGGFPARWSEWNGKFRDDVRDFWRGTDGALGEFTQRLLGSGDVYGPTGRDPLCSVNFITAHDGFTLSDLTSYDEKHNDANGEDNNDGESDNRSWNGGAEGTTDDVGINALRARQRRNLLTTLMLSAGVPMVLGGDELGRTQGGNNNAYCQDDEISWYDWEAADADQQEFFRDLTRMRHEHPVLRPRHYGDRTVSLHRTDGPTMSDGDWADGRAKTLLVRLVPGAESVRDTHEFLLLVNAHDDAVQFTMPADDAVEHGRTGTGTWDLAVSTDTEQTVDHELVEGEQLLITDRSITVLRRRVG